MKFLHYAALILGATAMKLEQQSAAPTAYEPHNTMAIMIDDELGVEDDGPTQKEIHELIVTIANDIKDNGPMDRFRFYDVLKGWMKDYAIPPPDAKKGWMRRLFKSIDADKSGKIDSAEFTAAVTAADK